MRAELGAIPAAKRLHDAEAHTLEHGGSVVCSVPCVIARPNEVLAHLLRHTAASGFLRAQTGNVIELQRQLGWSDIRMAMRYVHETEAEEMVSRPSPLDGLKAQASGQFSTRAVTFKGSVAVSPRTCGAEGGRTHTGHTTRIE